jgi:hypothetical protein
MFIIPIHMLRDSLSINLISSTEKLSILSSNQCPYLLSGLTEFSLLEKSRDSSLEAAAQFY